MSLKNICQSLILVLSFITLLYLGNWQLERLDWKNNVIKQLSSEYAKDPKKFTYSFKDIEAFSTDKNAIRYGSAKGVFDYDKEILMGPHSHEKKISYKVITPLELSNNAHILVHRGWIKLEDKEQITNLQNRPKGPVTISGIFRAPEWNSFTPNNSPENNVWTKLDIQEIANVKKITPIAPAVLYAEFSSKEFGLITMNATKWFPRNKHRQYAIFWFGMAFILIIISGVYYRQSRKA